MTNQIPQSSQRFNPSVGPTVKLEAKAQKGQEVSSDDVSFSGLLTDLSTDGEKQSDAYIENQRHTNIKKLPTQGEVELEGIEKKPTTGPQTTQNAEVIALFNLAVTKEKAAPDASKEIPAENKPLPNSAKPRSQNPHIDNAAQAVDDASQEELSAERNLVGGNTVARVAATKTDKAASAVNMKQAPVNREETGALDHRQANSKVMEGLQRQQLDDKLKENSSQQTATNQSDLSKSTDGVKAMPVESLQRSNQKASPSEKNVPHVATTESFETIEVVESSKAKFFPADVEKHAWKQIGQKITQSMAGSAAPQSSASLEQSASPHITSSNMSKTIKHLKIQLKPENLGTVDVKLTMINGNLEVTLSASDRNMAGKLLEGSDHLSKQLKAAGIVFENLSVQLTDTEATSPTRMTNSSGNNDAEQNLNGQKQSQTNNKSSDQTRDQRSESSNQEQNRHDQNDEQRLPIDPVANPRGNVFL